MFCVRGLDMRTMTTSYGKNPHLSKLVRVQGPATGSSPQKRRRLHQALGLLMPAGAFVVIYRLLSHVSADVIDQMLWGLGGIACALGGLATLLWCIRWGLAWDNAQEEARIRNEPVLAKNERTKRTGVFMIGLGAGMESPLCCGIFMRT